MHALHQWVSYPLFLSAIPSIISIILSIYGLLKVIQSKRRDKNTKIMMTGLIIACWVESLTLSNSSLQIYVLFEWHIFPSKQLPLAIVAVIATVGIFSLLLMVVNLNCRTLGLFSMLDDRLRKNSIQKFSLFMKLFYLFLVALSVLQLVMSFSGSSAYSVILTTYQVTGAIYTITVILRKKFQMK